MSCPQEPVPAGWRLWKGPVPTELTQLAMDVRDHVRDFAYGSIAKTVQYQGQTVGVFVSHHTWTYRGGQLISNICIPGCSLITQLPPGASATSTPPDDLSKPDPTAAVFGADDVPARTTDWRLVAITVGVTTLVVGGFFAALHFAGRPRLAA